ncbi:MAG: beta-lactamase family protein [Saprospiraceae bacterium]|nr:beta-lactamase family protein [Saprospiraceae bacterium]
MKQYLLMVFFVGLLGASLAQPAIPESRWAQMREYVAAQPDFSGVLLVASGGQTRILQGYGLADRAKATPVTGQTLFDIGSITKSFTATAILKLMEAGKLKPEDPLSRFFADVPADKKDITLHQLLTHSAGLPDAIGRDYAEITAEAFLTQTWAEPLAFAPGKGYQYSNVGYSILGILLERLSGQRYGDFLREQVFQPAGMRTAGYQAPAAKDQTVAHGYRRDGEDWGRPTDKKWDGAEPYWHLKANGGLLMSGTDLFNWYLALRHHKVLKPESLRLQTSPHVDEGGGQSYYGYGLVNSDEGQCIQHNGGNGIFKADFKWFPGQDAVIFAATGDANVRLFAITNVLKQILLTGKVPVQIDWKPVDLQRFPANSREQTAKALMQTLEHFSTASADTFLEKYCTTGFLTRNDKAQLVQFFEMMSNDAHWDALDALMETEHQLLLVAKAKGGGKLKLTMIFEGDKMDKMQAELE